MEGAGLVTRLSPAVLPEDALLPLPLSARPTVSIVICAYAEERLESLTRLLEALPRQSSEPDEVILVIDGNPRLAAIVRERFHDIRVVENEGPHGHAGAANQGIATTDADLIALIDDDAIPADERWLEWLVRGYEQENVLGVGGAVEPVWLVGRPAWFPDEFLWVVGGSHRGLPTELGAVRNLWMGNMSVRRSVIDAIGGFRPSLSRVGKRPFGAQETEFCVRAAQRWPNGAFLYEPRARVFHEVPAQRATFAYFRSHCFDEATAKVSMSRHVGSRDGLASEWVYFTRILPAGIVRGVGDTLLRRDPSGLARAATIIIGAAAAVCGYLRARLFRAPVAEDEELDIGRETGRHADGRPAKGVVGRDAKS
jgi:glycosyltransferase involved in cell wall biosynthesis